MPATSSNDSAATVRFVLLQQRLEPRHDFRFLAILVYALRKIPAQVIEFAGKGIRCVTSLTLEPIGLSVVAAAVADWRVNEHPVILPDGEMAVCAMEHRRLTDCVFQFLAQQCGQNVITVLTGIGR